jgi:hypothetical protein
MNSTWTNEEKESNNRAGWVGLSSGWPRPSSWAEIASTNKQIKYAHDADCLIYKEDDAKGSSSLKHIMLSAFF